MPNLDTPKRRRWPRCLQCLAKAWLFSDQHDIQAAGRNCRKNTVNLDAGGPVGPHGVDGYTDLPQVLSSSLFSTTMRSL
jgi:hypothetical protein